MYNSYIWQNNTTDVGLLTVFSSFLTVEQSSPDESISIRLELARVWLLSCSKAKGKRKADSLRTCLHHILQTRHAFAVLESMLMPSNNSNALSETECKQIVKSLSLLCVGVIVRVFVFWHLLTIHAHTTYRSRPETAVLKVLRPSWQECCESSSSSTPRMTSRRPSTKPSTALCLPKRPKQRRKGSNRPSLHICLPCCRHWSYSTTTCYTKEERKCDEYILIIGAKIVLRISEHECMCLFIAMGPSQGTSQPVCWGLVPQRSAAWPGLQY